MGITLKNVSYTYQAGTPFESPALFEVNLEIKNGGKFMKLNYKKKFYFGLMALFLVGMTFSIGCV